MEQDCSCVLVASIVLFCACVTDSTTTTPLNSQSQHQPRNEKTSFGDFTRLCTMEKPTSPPEPQEENKPTSHSESQEEPKEKPTSPVSAPEPQEEKTKNSDETKKEGDEVKKISKNALKRKLRFERLQEVGKRQKQQKKDSKAAKAKEMGRDMDEEKKIQAEKALIGASRLRRRERWLLNKQPKVAESWQVCLDCSFEEFMTPKEINSLALQIRYCYGNNRRNSHPCALAATSLTGGTLKHLENVMGFSQWSDWAWSCTDKSLEEYYEKDLSNVVYLTSDSENTLQDLDDSKIYVIGGIVDRNRLKRGAIDRAEKLGIVTARLPLDEHLRKMEATRVLTCNHVFDILLHYRENGKDWKKALEAVMPQRKEAEFVEEGTTSIAT
jgi:tRNA (guanine9-N1)-methyltransferase